MRRCISVGGMIAVMLGTLILGSPALTQTSAVQASLVISNENCKDGVLISQLIILQGILPLHISILQPAIEIAAGAKREFTMQLKDTPTGASIIGRIGRQELNLTVKLGTTQYTCGVIQFSYSGGQPPPTTGQQKPLAPGQSYQQTIQTLQGLGINTNIEGTQDKPKLGDVSDPMLLRNINGFSAQLIWVTAPGSLRAVITWDRPAVDLDLIVFGLPFGFCFQLNAAGILAETCDRPPFGPVPGAVFAVFIINWSAVSQAYVLSLST